MDCCNNEMGSSEGLVRHRLRIRYPLANLIDIDSLTNGSRILGALRRQATQGAFPDCQTALAIVRA